ncbi:hypothetical protein Ac2012v2_005364 [Leucoagaricus gongylophorus]
MKFIMPSDIIPAAFIVGHCHSSFLRAITISHFPSSGGKEVRLMFRQEEKPDTEVCMVKPLQYLVVIYVYKNLINYSTGSVQLSTTNLAIVTFSVLNYNFGIHLLHRKTRVVSE